MNFRFAEKTEPAREATKLANNMQICAPEHTVCGPELIFSLDMAGRYKTRNTHIPHSEPLRSNVSSFSLSVQNIPAGSTCST